jgi:hypothetical protein
MLKCVDFVELSMHLVNLIKLGMLVLSMQELDKLDLRESVEDI